MDALDLAKQAKKKNIIEMAIRYVPMMPLFRKGSADLINGKLTELLEELDRVSSEADFNKIHRELCRWFVKTIRLAKSEQPSSYGHAAKVLDLALKVYVYYCKMPDPAKADALIPMLNGAIDTQLLRYLCTKVEDIYGKSYSRQFGTIEMLGNEDYDLLQKVIRQDIRDSFDGDILPVQYDDIMWRRLNR